LQLLLVQLEPLVLDLGEPRASLNPLHLLLEPLSVLLPPLRLLIRRALDGVPVAAAVRIAEAGKDGTPPLLALPPALLGFGLRPGQSSRRSVVRVHVRVCVCVYVRDVCVQVCEDGLDSLPHDGLGRECQRGLCARQL
jgi:hypothetical protein